MAQQRTAFRQAITISIPAIVCLWAMALVCLCHTAFAAEQPGRDATSRAANGFAPLGLQQVKVGGEIGRRIDVTIDNNLMKIDVDKDFLEPFVQKDHSSGFVGVGMLIDAAAGLAAYSKDPLVIARKEHLIDTLLANQEEDGYIGMMKPEARIWALWDIHEMAYIIQGLVRDYRLFGNERSLLAARKVANCIIDRWTAEPDRKPGGGDITVFMAVTGIEPAMLMLYAETGCPRYLTFCTQFRKLGEWKPDIIIGRWGPVGGHAYAHCSRTIAQLWLDAVLPDRTLLNSSRDVMDFLLKSNGIAITGACGYRECWHDTQDGTAHLGETCATAYLLRLWNELLLGEGSSLYGDLMERAIYNALFSAQSRDGRKIRYYVPTEGPRVYFPRDSYCCPNNYRRVVSLLPRYVYYTTADGVAVNLYTPSTAELKLPDGIALTLRQETEYPSDGKVTIHVTPSEPCKFAVRLRIPRWTTDATIAVNGEKLDQPCTAGSFVTVSRSWKEGDRIELDLPMSWRWIRGRRAQAGRVALMRGPIVFCLNRASHDELKDVDLRELVVVPETLEGPVADDSVRPGGLACKLRAWGPEQWYPHSKPAVELTLTESVDPGSEQTWFKIANPREEYLVDDELINIPVDRN